MNARCSVCPALDLNQHLRERGGVIRDQLEHLSQR